MTNETESPQESIQESKDKLRSHSYDGIQEYDNQLPRWWVQLFWITIFFGTVYLYHYHFKGDDIGLDAEYRVAKQAADQAVALAPKASGDLNESQLLAFVKDEKIVGQGAQIFTEKCVSCHGDHAQGLVGPNLTDDFWIHGSSMKSIITVIHDGVPAKGMIPWGGMLKAEEIQAVAAFIKSLRGSNPAHPKAPEGTKE